MVEIYLKRIQRGARESFNTKKLGAFGSELAVLSTFFDTTWGKPVSSLEDKFKGYVLNEAGFDLRAFGWLADAAQPMQVALEVSVTQKDWFNAAGRAGNLSELYLTIGDVKAALVYAEQSVGLADKSGDESQRFSKRTTFADALHQAGRLVEAQKAFLQSEEMQKKFQPKYPFLYSLWGFRYCDLLLSQGNYAEVERRSSQTVQYANQGWYSLLDIALDNLSLGRALTYLAPGSSPTRRGESAITYLDRAVDGLRQAGTQHMLPLGLLARAAYYRVIDELDKAGKDLDEAFMIASRGGMGLHLEDCHLEYARLSKAKNEKQKAREHLDIAKEMIEKMGYHRRDKEVEELEEALSS